MKLFQRPLLLAFVIGMIVGVFYLNLIAIDYFEMSGIFNIYYLEAYTKLDTDLKNSLPYFAISRIIPLTVLWVMTYSKVNKVIVILALLWTGFLGGIYLALGASQLNAVGVLFCVIGLLPQMLFYIPAYLIVLIYVYRYPESKWNSTKILVILSCLICGIFSEAQLNPILLTWVIEGVL